MIRTMLDALLVLLAFSLPFEIIHPVLVLPWFEFTNLELVALACIAVWVYRAGARSVAAMRPTSVRSRAEAAWLELRTRPVVWLPLAFLALSVLSAALAPAGRVDALKFATRVGTGTAVFWMLIDTVRSRSLMTAILWALLAGAGVSSVVGLGEALEWPHVASLLPLFKDAPTRIGGELRVGASFQYATMAAIYFEMTALVALGLAADARARPSRGLALLVGLLCTANVVLSQSRAGIVTLGLLLALLLGLAWRRPRLRPLAPPALLALGTLSAVTAGLAWRTDAFRTRMLTEDDLGWYGAEYAVPPELRMRAGEPVPVLIGVENTGAIRWHTTGEHPFALGYYWLTEDGRPIGGGHLEAPLPGPVDPGDSVRVAVSLRPSLPPGDYRLAWGMLQRRILWFRHRGVPEGQTAVRLDPGTVVEPPPVDTASGVPPGGAMPSLPATVRRLDLWTAAARMWLERPILGIGPDNFRHLYGRYLGLDDWDRRLHSNSLYLELLAGWGLAGTLVFAAFAVLILRLSLPTRRRVGGASALRSVTLGASFLAFFVHGSLDYFLPFVPLYLLFWMVAGLIVVAARTTAEERTGV